MIAGPHDADRLSLEARRPPITAWSCSAASRGCASARRRFGYGRVDPEVATATEEAARAFAELGAEVEEVTPEFGDSTELYRVFLRVGAASAGAESCRRARPSSTPASSTSRTPAWRSRRSTLPWRGASGTNSTTASDASSRTTICCYRRPCRSCRCRRPERRRSALARRELDRMVAVHVPVQSGAAAAASVPVGWSRAGLPIGLQIVGQRFADLAVLQGSAPSRRRGPRRICGRCRCELPEERLDAGDDSRPRNVDQSCSASGSGEGSPTAPRGRRRARRFIAPAV